MSKFQIVKGITDNLEDTPYVEGKVYFTYEDTESEDISIYADIDGVRRKIKEGVQREELNNYLLKTDIAAWAKEATKPTYTASEVGALPDTTIITDEKVKQTPLNNSQNSRALLMGKDLGNAETTSTAYMSNKLIWNDYLKTLSIYGASTENNYIKSGCLGYISGETYSAEIQYPSSFRENYIYTLPKATGTVALTSDIPTVPTTVSSFTNDSGYLTLADLPIYDGTVV